MSTTTTFPISFSTSLPFILDWHMCPAEVGHVYIRVRFRAQEEWDSWQSPEFLFRAPGGTVSEVDVTPEEIVTQAVTYLRFAWARGDRDGAFLNGIAEMFSAKAIEVVK